MTGDDDIPVLTKVVKRERRAHPALNDTMRRAIIADVSQRVDGMIADAARTMAADIDALLTRELHALVETRLPELIDAAIRAQIELARNAGDDDA